MQTMRLTQNIVRGGHRIDITLTGDGAHRSATARFEWRMNSQDQEDMRWYPEDYLGYPVHPAPEIVSAADSSRALPYNFFTIGISCGTDE
jgi:hypothetical protein